MKITKTSVESKMTITVTILFNNLRSINLVHVYERGFYVIFFLFFFGGWGRRGDSFQFY